MKRLLATVRTDVRLQFRNGFYYAVAFVLVIFGIAYSQLPEFDWSYWIAPVVFGNLSMVTFYFMGGLVLLEKGEGTLEAQVVTPLRISEYLGSKIITLTALSLLENLAIVVIISGFQHRFAMFTLGVMCAAVIYILLGFIAVARYDSINEYIMPSALIITALSIPFLDYFALWETPLMILHPLQGSLIIMRAAFLPVPGIEIGLGVLSSLVWIGLAGAMAHRSFHRFLVRKEGVR